MKGIGQVERIDRRIPNRIRMPLKIGMDCLWKNTMGLSTLPLSLAIIGGWIAGSIYLGGCLEVLVGKGVWYTVILLTYIFLSMSVVAALTSYTFVILLKAMDEGARDVVLSREGVSVEEGDFRREFTWEAIIEGRCSISTSGETDQWMVFRFVAYNWLLLLLNRYEEGGAREKTTSLWLELGDDRHLLATAERREERASLHALHDTIESMSSGSGEDIPVDESAATISIVECGNCGASVAPRDAEVVTCHYCGQDVRIPGAVRDRLAGLEKLRKDREASERNLRSLLDQPGARSVHRRLRWANRLMRLICLALPAFLLILGIRGALDVTNVVLACVSYCLLFVAVYFFFKSTLVSRKALRVLLLDFTAVPPAREDAPYRCRRCAAPLTVETERMIAYCPYCETENIVGMNLDSRVGRMEARSQDLQAMWAEQRWRKTKATLVGIASLLLFAANIAFMINHFSS